MLRLDLDLGRYLDLWREQMCCVFSTSLCMHAQLGRSRAEVLRLGIARSGACFCAQDFQTVVFVVDRSQHPPSLREILLYLNSKIQKFEINLSLRP